MHCSSERSLKQFENEGARKDQNICFIIGVLDKYRKDD
jgi:hypothetical protein